MSTRIHPKMSTKNHPKRRLLVDKSIHEKSPKSVHRKSPFNNVHEKLPILKKKCPQDFDVHEMSPSLIYWFLTNKLATQQVFFACNRSSINFNAFIRSWCWTQFIYQVSKLLAPVIYFAKTFKFSSVCRIKDCSKRFSNTLFRLVQIFMRKIICGLLGKSNKHSTHDFYPRPARK